MLGIFPLPSVLVCQPACMSCHGRQVSCSKNTSDTVISFLAWLMELSTQHGSEMRKPAIWWPNGFCYLFCWEASIRLYAVVKIARCSCHASQHTTYAGE